MIVERIILNFSVVFGSQCLLDFFLKMLNFEDIFGAYSNDNNDGDDYFIFSLRGIVMKQHEKQYYYLL